MIPKINSAHGSDTRNILNRAIDSINVQGKTIQDLVAEGQLTPTQYAQLISIINGNIKSGAITIDDVDKNNFRIDQTMITDDLRRIITGDTPINAVPADNSLNTAKYKNDSVTRDKRTVGGERASTLTWNKLPNIDLINKKVVFYPQTEIVHSKGRTVLSDKIELDLIPSFKLLIITFNTLNETLKVIDANGINNMTEYEVFVMRVSFVDGVTQNEILDVVCDSDYTVNGVTKVADNSVSESSLETTLKENIYSGSTLKITNWELGQLIINTGAEMVADNIVRTGFIKMSAGDILSMDNEIHNGFRVFYYDLDKKFIKQSDFVFGVTISDEIYIRLQSRYKDSRKITDPSLFDGLIKITRSRLTDKEKSALYDGEIYLTELEVGEISVYDGSDYNYSISRVRSKAVKVAKGNKVRMEENDDLLGIYLFMYDLDMNYIGTKPFSFEHTIDDDMYVRVQSGYKDNRDIIDIKTFVDKIFVDRLSSESSSKSQQLFGNFNNLYQTYPIENTETIATSKFTDVYSKFDELVFEYSGIMTRNLRGHGTDSNGLEDTNLPIYEYVIENPQESKMGTLPNISPTMLIACNIHGSEKTPPWATYYFIKQMLERYHENDILGGIKSNVVFKIIPIANPGGYDDVTYHNRNDVNLNRNFGYNWDSVGNQNEARGAAPYSEYESKALKSWLDENLGGNNIFIDFHNTGEDYGTSYLTAHEKIIEEGYSSLIKRLTDIWKRRYDIPLDTDTYGWVIGNVFPTIYNEAYYIQEIKSSALLEISWDFKGVYHTTETFERGVDLLANYIQLTLRLYNDGLV